MAFKGFDTKRSRAALVLVLGIGILSGCAAVATGLPSFRRETSALFQAVYRETDEIYIDPLDARRFTLAGLRGLRRIDPSIEISEEGDVLFLIVNGETVDSETMPGESAGAAAWARLASDLTVRARNLAPLAETAGSDAIHEAFIDSALLTLDRFSHYANPTDAADLRAEREGFGGIGIDIEPHPKGARIQGLEPNHPAAREGLLVGDVIVQVDGADIAGESLRDITHRLRGPQGTPVDLTIIRDGLSSPRTITVRRTRIVPNTVFYETRGDHALIRISGFNKLTSKRLAEAVSQVRAEQGAALNGLILDLRDNLGGLLDQAVMSADLFMTRGLITRADGRHPESHQRFDAEPGDIATGLRIVVLINGASASAAEILASALQDKGRAVVVGMSSFGKGSIQNLIQLPNGGELYITWAKFVAPSGYALDRIGVMPTVCTSGAGDAVDALDRALKTAALGTKAPLALRRSVDPTDEAAVRRLLAACPWTPRVSDDIDIAIAELLLESPALVRQALRVGRVPDGA